MNKVKRIVFALLLAVASYPLSAQEKAESGNAYIFRFVADKDMFFSPWSGNGKELDRLLAAIEKNRAALDAGNMYLCVTSYGTAGNAEQTAAEVAKIRRNRVKSELIVRGKVKESHFVTDKSLKEACKTEAGELHNIIVVVLPASVEKVAEIAGMEAAAKVEAYNREVSGEAEKARQTEAQRIAAEKSEAERIAKEKEQAEQKRLAEGKAAKERAEQAEQERLAAGQAVKEQGKEELNKTTAYHFLQGWYAGVQGGLPFGISGMSSFGADKTRVGWNVGLYGGYRFSSVFSLEAQAAWGQMNLSVRNCCSGYWLGSDGVRYESAVAGMEGWNYTDLKSRVATQRYGVQLNVNILGFFNSTKTGRWTLELSPQLSAMGTKAAFRTIADNAVAMKGATRWHFGAGGNLQAGYGITEHLHIVLYTGLTYLTGKPMDGLPAYRHKNNFVWEGGLRLGWRFGNNGKEVRK